MYVKTTSRKTKHGAVRYLHLAHNQWDATAGRSVPKLLYSFGRADQLDRDAVKRLVTSLARLLDPAEALAASTTTGLAFLESRPYGGAFVLDHVWHQLRLPQVITGLRTHKRGHPRNLVATERVLFGLVANRALEPSSKLASADWITHDVHIDHLPAIDEDACYRAMDWLHGANDALERQVFDQLATLLTSRSICCSSTRPRPTSSSTAPMLPSSVTT